MNTGRTASFFSRLFRGSPAATRLDPADVGTAFGLDISLTPDYEGSDWPTDVQSPPTTDAFRDGEPPRH